MEALSPVECSCSKGVCSLNLFMWGQDGCNSPSRYVMYEGEQHKLTLCKARCFLALMRLC
eukprot:6416376-Amphidinium_carterae.1